MVVMLAARNPSQGGSGKICSLLRMLVVVRMAA